MPKNEEKKEAKVDDLGIEIDEEIEQLRADPKTGLIDKYLDYRERRKQKEAEKKRQEEEEQQRSKKKSFWD